MSLLMDALKKAEQAKRRAAADGERTTDTSSAAELELAPLEDSRPTGTAGIQLDELRLEVLDDQFETPTANKFRNELPRRAAAAEAAATATVEERAAARNIFEAKQSKRSGKLFAIVVGALTLVAVAAIGIYFWLQLAVPGTTLLASNVPVATVRPPASTTKPIAAAPLPAPTTAAAAIKKLKPATRARTPEVPPLPSSDGDAPIRVTSSRLAINPLLARAYDAFVAGDMATAARDYTTVLQGDARNSDALLGMAAVHLRQGQPGLAEDFYLRTLEADPKNALAQAGLISLHSQGDPVQAESHLHTLIAAQPDLPPLHFVLGNVYARQGRWNDAQRAYFKAYSGDTANPDYLFNLAVSLDRMRQPKLAAQYYNQALVAAAERHSSFDRAQVSARLHDLLQ